jgi:hypothetical protein
VCNGEDDDCDGSVDEDVQLELWADTDGDGFGDPEVALEACETSRWWVDNARDCDDGDATRNPDAVETCDGSDNDCDDATDEEACADSG